MKESDFSPRSKKRNRRERIRSSRKKVLSKRGSKMMMSKITNKRNFIGNRSKKIDIKGRNEN